MKTYVLLFALFVLPFLAVSQKKEKGLAFEDTLSKYRPRYDYKKEVFTGTPIVKEVLKKKNTPPDSSNDITRFDVTAKFNEMLDYRHPLIGQTIIVIRQGWRVQVYRGKDEAEANGIRSKCYTVASEHSNYLMFSRPDYRVKVGDFLERQQAFALYKQLKRRFPESVIVPDSVRVIKIADQDDIIEMQRREAQKRGQRGG